MYRTTMEDSEEVYIEYLNKDKKFKRDKIGFTGSTAYQQAVQWGKKNLPNFHPDMIHYKK